MSVLENLTGQRFGLLTVVARGAEKPDAKWSSARWDVACDCGGKKTVYAGDLKSGSTTSCGCVQKEAMRQIGEQKRENLSGRRYGLLTVEGYVEATEKSRDGKWRVVCDCGNVRHVVRASLTLGKTTSCGCGRTAAGKARKAALAEQLKNEEVKEGS